jgi:hypothetical protein
MSDDLSVWKYPQQHLDEEKFPKEFVTHVTDVTLTYTGEAPGRVYYLHMRKTSRGSIDQEDGGVLSAVRRFCHFRHPRKGIPHIFTGG